MSDTAVKVTISDPDTGEVFDETVIDNDYSIVCAGTCHVASAQAYANGTHVLTVKGRENGHAETPGSSSQNGSDREARP